MRRPEGFDAGRDASIPEEDTEPTRPKVQARVLKLSRLAKEHRPSARQVAEAEPASAAERGQAAESASKSRRVRRERPPRRVPTEAERAAREAKTQATAARREARRAARERRRFERSEVRRFTRRARHRRLAWLTAAGVTLVLGTLIAVAVFSPLLALREIRVTGTTRLDAVQVREAVESQLDTPLALLDFDVLRSDLSGFPLIRSYVTETVPPHTLVIHITERQPVAALLTGAGYLLLDPAGVEIERSETRPAGVPLLDLAEEEIAGDAFDSAIEVLLALPEPLLAQVDSVSATTMDDVTLVFAGVGQRVVWGSAAQSELKARVLERLMGAHDPGARVEFDVTAPLSAVVRPA